jgi:hypothetical protein
MDLLKTRFVSSSIRHSIRNDDPKNYYLLFQQVCLLWLVLSELRETTLFLV